MKLAELSQLTDVQVDDHLDLDEIVPVSDGLQAQGDLIVVPEAVAKANGAKVSGGWSEVPPRGVVVLAGTHDHVLVGDLGKVRFTTDVTDSQGLALGAVQADSTAWLVHQEHGGIGLAPGCYVLRGTREQAEIVRRVAD